MAEYKIREVLTRKDLKKFIKFPDELYKDNGYYVPALHSGQEYSLTKSSTSRYCPHKFWLVEKDGKVAGRICAMINPRYNEKYATKRARFGWFDTIEDIEVARLLLGTAEQWARARGMEEIHGPLGYNTMTRQGMLVEGYDKVPPFNCLYNFPYYNDFVTLMGYEKELDWIQYRMKADQGLPEKMKQISSRLQDRYNLKEADLKELRKDKENFRKFFRMYNDSFDGNVQNFIPLTPEEIDEEVDEIIDRVDSKVSCILMDEDNEVAGFGVALPSISMALRKAKGRLFPFGWIYMLKALKDYETLDLMINGAAPKWQNTGVSAVYHGILAQKYQACGAKWAISNPQIDTNSAVNVWDRYEHEFWLRRRCYIKKIK